MTLKTLMTTTAAAAIISTSAFAASDSVEQAAENEEIVNTEEGTTFDGEVVVDTDAELQNAETTNRQNPQAIDPVFDKDVSAETLATFKAIKGTSGSDVLLVDGLKLGTLLEMDIDNAGKGEMTIDISDSDKILGKELTVTTGPENVMISDGVIYIDVDADELANLAGGVQGADNGRQTVYLN